MKQKTIYCCELCDESFLSEIECEKHEAQHYGLTIEEYNQWFLLTTSASRFGKRLLNSTNGQRRKDFDDAIKKLVDFEVEHNLDKIDKKPRQFYY